jgi:hypothetical protein
MQIHCLTTVVKHIKVAIFDALTKKIRINIAQMPCRLVGADENRILYSTIITFLDTDV